MSQKWPETAHLLFTQLKKVLSVFKTLAFIDRRVIVQHTEEALKTPLMASGSTPPWPTSLQPTPFFLISTDMFETHMLGVDHRGVRNINSSALRLNRPHMSTKHTLPGIHRWVFAGEDHACSSRPFNPFTLNHIVKWDLICKFHLLVYVIFIFMPPHTFFVDLFCKSLSLQTQPVPKSWNDSQLINTSKRLHHVQVSTQAATLPTPYLGNYSVEQP